MDVLPQGAGIPVRARKLAGLLGYFVFLFVIIEIALQIFYYATAGDFLFRRTDTPLYQSEPFAGYMNRPGLAFDHHTNEFNVHYFTNQAGFRVAKPGIEYSIPKPAGTYRILLLGPSFAFGWGVEYEKSLAALLPQMLAGQGFAKGNRIELINAGIPAMPVAAQLNWYEHAGKKYQPDLIIQLVYGSMIVRSDPHSTIGADADGNLVDTALPESQRWRDRAKQSATVFYGWLLWTNLDTWLHADTKNSAVAGAGRDLVQESDFDPNKPNVHDATVFYKNLAKAAQESGAALQIVYFPLSYAIYPEDESRWRHMGIRDVPAQKAFDTAFVNYLNQQKIPTVDITPDLGNAATNNKKRLYYWLDIHWTAEGNTAAAHAVADALVRTGK